MAGRIVIGTSSWTDPGFVRDWYPARLPSAERLEYYARRFEAVEVNATFYAIPSERTVRGWARRTPDDFSFDIKLHRLLSRHAADTKSLPADMRARARVDARGRVRLDRRIERALVERLLESLRPLGPKLGTFLLQTSPSFDPREHRLNELARLIEQLAVVAPVAVELRNRFWLQERRLERTLDWLERHGAAFVCVDGPQGSSAPTIVPPIDAVTRPDVAYLRAHGRNLDGYLRGRTVAERFGYRYDDTELAELADRATELADRAAQVRVMFNNNRGADAPIAAERMRELLGQVVAA